MIVTLIFMDESGDTEFNFQIGASRYFAVVMVIFDSASEAERVIAALDALREELRLPPTYEFRFSTGSKTRFKEKFLQALLPYAFRYRAMLVDKHEFVKSVGGVSMWRCEGNYAQNNLCPL